MAERRLGTDRRCSRLALVLREKRTGFDRREPRAGLAGRALHALRERPEWLAILLISVNLANVLDIAFTWQALGRGMIEGNPVMAMLLAQSPLAALAFKVGLIAAITLVLWLMRRYKAALATALAGTTVYGMILAYHAVLSATVL